MTLANQVTIARILLIPVFVVEILYYRHSGVEMHRWIALGAFLIASVSDGIDGYIARRFNQRTRLGAVLDPLADKLLLGAALILLSLPGFQHLQPLPFWLIAIILSREVITFLGWAAIHYSCGQARVQPQFVGKLATVLQMAVVTMALLDLDPRWRSGLEIATAIVTGLSGLAYSIDGLRQLAASPHATPRPEDNAPPGT